MPLGVQGGKVIGATNNQGGRGPGSFATEAGWYRNREIRPEDIEATIFSALGINWTKSRNDDPLGHGFYYLPLARHDAYAPVHELWGEVLCLADSINDPVGGGVRQGAFVGALR